ncbi:hypothetical protein CL634_01205 [bacterium]|nr:hypothetical protein [bacterium]
MNYEFNGLLDSALPNVYVNKITLERLYSKPLSTNKYDMMPHIEPSTEQEAAMGLKYASDTESLKIVVDMFLEIPNVESDDFWNFLFDSDITELMSTYLMIFHGDEGKNWFMYTMNQQPGTGSTGTTLLSYLASLSPSPAGIQLETTTGMFGTESNSSLEHIKQKYAKTLPDGTVVHKIPVRMEAQLSSGAFPKNLAVAAWCTLDADSVMNTLQYTDASYEDIASINLIGRVATEVIIKDNKIQDRGMMFFISENQEDNEAFNHLKGQLWLGGVHKHNNRYMAGNNHMTQLHPYLDYIMVPNTRIHDFRQVATIQKQIMNFNPMTEAVFGGNGTDLRSTKNNAASSFDNPAIFSNLISSIDSAGRTKLFFSVDWGRLIKKHGAVPALLDKLVSSNTIPGALDQIFGEAPLSIRVFRERQTTSNKAINRADKELIYDGYPEPSYATPRSFPLAVSTLLADIELGQGFSAKGWLRHYTFTDWDVGKITSGVYKYSIEIVIKDPTLNFLIGRLNEKLIPATDVLKLYTLLANGSATAGSGKLEGTATTSYYNSYLGEFEEGFKVEAKVYGFGSGVNAPLPVKITDAVTDIKFLTSVMRSRNVSPHAGVQDENSNIDSLDWSSLLKGMLNPSTASPDSIVTVYNIFNTLTGQLRNFIQSFAIAKLPKTDTTGGDPNLKNLTKTPGGTPQRKIKIEHTFEDSVNTMYMDGAYDFFGSLADSWNGQGLKRISYEKYLERSQDEHGKYFKPTTENIPIGFQNYRQNNEIFYASIDVQSTKGRFFTIPQESANLSVVLPSSIKSVEEENSYWQLINNVIRYKFNLLGNPNEASWLGYNPATQGSPYGLEVGDVMERILKEHQALHYKNAIIIQDREILPINPIITEGILELPEISFPNATQFPGDSITAIPQNENTGIDSDPLPNNAQNEQEIDIFFPTKWEYTSNVGQERFLLSLIMDSYFNLNTYDIKLGAFNPRLSMSPMGIYLNSFMPKGLDRSPENAVKTVIERMPPSTVSLIINTEKPEELPASTRYVGNPQNKLYVGSDSDNTTMFIDKFGMFWFKHQNLVEIQYLSSYANTEPLPGPSVKFEDTYNSSVMAPVWTALDLNTVQQLTTGGAGRLLCRFKKYRSSFFNREAYNTLDLPLLDEYFFLEMT